MNKNRPPSSVVVQIIFLFVFFSLLITFLNMMGIPNPFYNPFQRPVATPKPVAQAPSELGADERATIEVFKKTSPSVVFIINTAYRRDFFSTHTSEVPQGSGSGFIWDSDGHIVTNYHVIQDANGVEVTLNDQSVWRADIVGIDADHDLAVLRIGASQTQLHPVAIGTSKDLQVGQKVQAIGNPFGLDTTLTVGIISALGRNIKSITDRPIYDVIQTDAAINPGNSGGPLLDSFGRVIGVNTAIMSPSGTSAGIGFAVPVDTVNRIVPQLISKGVAAKPYLGVGMMEEYWRNRFKELGYNDLHGAVVLRVYPGSPADQAGLQGPTQDQDGRIILGDIITAIDGKEVEDGDDLIHILDSHSPGDEVILTVKRDKEIREVHARLGARQD